MKQSIILLIIILGFISCAFADYGGIEITTSPTLECMVYLDNIYVGTTPSKIDNVGIGTHLIEATYNDLRVFSDNVEVQNNKVSKIKIKIDPKYYQNINIEPQPFEPTLLNAKLPSNEAIGNKEYVSAEPRIKRLIEKERDAKESSGNMIIGLGGITALTGVFSGSKYSGGYISCGLLYAGLGMWSKTFKSELEMDYERILKINDQTSQGRTERARNAEDALSKVAEKMKNDRHTSSNMLIGLGVLYTATGVGAIIGLPMIGLAWSQYDVKSDYEKEYDAYLKEKGET